MWLTSPAPLGYFFIFGYFPNAFCALIDHPCSGTLGCLYILTYNLKLLIVSRCDEMNSNFKFKKFVKVTSILNNYKGTKLAIIKD